MLGNTFLFKMDFVKASSAEETSKKALEYREANELSKQADDDVHFSPFF